MDGIEEESPVGGKRVSGDSVRFHCISSLYCVLLSH